MSRPLARRCHLCLALAATAVAVAFAPQRGVQAAETAWRVGLASACITPGEPIRMAGYAGRTQLSEGVLDDLFAKAMALEDAGGSQALLITADLIGFRGPLAEEICRAIGEKTGLGRRQILLCPSHTHAGPVLGSNEGALYGLPDDQIKVVHDYSNRVVAALADLAAAALADLNPARLSWGSGTATFVMNRREFTDRGVRLGVNPSGYADRAVPVLRVDSPDGQPRAVVFGCACHNTTCTGSNLQICGDYAGFAERAIQEEHSGVQAMFVIGCGGDANPYPRSTTELAQEHGKSLAAEVCRVMSEEMAPVEGRLRTELDWVKLPLAPVPSQEKLEEMAKGPNWISFNAVRMLEAVSGGESLLGEYEAPFAVWQFGDDLTLVAMPGETVGGYVPLLRDALGPLKLWSAGYANDCFGYLPTAKVLAEGGYETRGLIGEVGFFAPEAQDVAVAAVRRLAERAGRPLPQ
jgi:neutral ceramidase